MLFAESRRPRRNSARLPHLPLAQDTALRMHQHFLQKVFRGPETTFMERRLDMRHNEAF
jgi:hypothetical protein